MPIRSAINRAHRAALFLVLTAALTVPAAARADGDDVELTLPQARQIAVQALQNGDLGIAVQMAQGLLKADPKDELALYVIASAQSQLGNAQTSRKAAAQAYRASDRKIDKFVSAQLAARMAFSEKRYSLSQVWLRRSAIHAPDAKAEQVVARDYAVLRWTNPWAFRLQVDGRPSSNVNQGADSALQIIDGIPVTGNLSRNAQALSGVIGALDLFSSYRVSRTEKSETSVTGRVYIQRVALSSSAKDAAPNTTNSDFASTYGEVSLRHVVRVGKQDNASVDLAYGESWNRSERSFAFARVTGDRKWVLNAGATIKVYALYENRFRARYNVNDAQILGFGGRYRKPLRNGDRLTLTMALRDTRAQHVNGTYSSASLRTAYDFGKPMGPIKLRAGLVLGYSDYPVFRSAGFFFVPGGRQDKSVYGDISMLFYEYDYAGFAPMLRLRAGRKSSNDSRYSLRELSLSVGIQSKF